MVNDAQTCCLACRNGLSARYLRVPRLLTDLTIARGDGTWSKVLAQLAKTDLIYTTRSDARADLFDYIEMFYNRKRRHGFNNRLSPLVFEEQFNQRFESV